MRLLSVALNTQVPIQNIEALTKHSTDDQEPREIYIIGFETLSERAVSGVPITERNRVVVPCSTGAVYDAEKDQANETDDLNRPKPEFEFSVNADGTCGMS